LRVMTFGGIACHNKLNWSISGCLNNQPPGLEEQRVS
jgi:hypothetical protein